MALFRHSKGPCDGVGGTVKRLAAKASLQRPYTDQITTPMHLYQWALENVSSVNFIFSTQDEYVDSEQYLANRLSSSVTIKGTQKLHGFIPIPSNTSNIRVKTFSLETESNIVKVGVSDHTLRLSDVRGYVCLLYEQNWWLAYVLEKNENEDEVKVSFLHPAGPSPSFSYPKNQDILWVSITDLICLVNPTTPTGRVYTLSKKEVSQISELFKTWKRH